jgi:hypothetical protein
VSSAHAWAGRESRARSKRVSLPFCPRVGGRESRARSKRVSLPFCPRVGGQRKLEHQSVSHCVMLCHVFQLATCTTIMVIGVLGGRGSMPFVRVSCVLQTPRLQLPTHGRDHTTLPTATRMDLFWQFHDCLLVACGQFGVSRDSGIVDAQAVFRIPTRICVIGR